MQTNFLLENLESYLLLLPAEFDMIPELRKTRLQQLSDYVRAKKEAQEAINAIVICTHNSRRSHIGQIWLQVAAACYGIDKFKSYSGGTEGTAFHPNAIAAMNRTGMQVATTDEGKNPVYKVTFSEEHPNTTAFSKSYDDDANPKKNFVAIMVCTDADEACPFIPGADLRISLPFDDPKAFDNTDLQDIKYAERARQIARELFYAMSLV